MVQCRPEVGTTTVGRRTSCRPCRSAVALSCALLSACSPQTYAVSDPSKTEAGIVFDIGGKDDRSFNAAAWNGVKCAETGTLAGWHGLRKARPRHRPARRRAGHAGQHRAGDARVCRARLRPHHRRRLRAGADPRDRSPETIRDIHFAIIDGVSRAARTSPRWCSRSTKGRIWSACSPR